MHICLHLLVILWNCVELSISQESPLVRVVGDHTFNKNLEDEKVNLFKRRDIVANADAAMRWNHRRTQPSASDIIFAPLKDHRVITKERMFPSSKNVDKLLEPYSNDQTNERLDPIFVTAPPARTTIAVRFEAPEPITDVIVSGGKGEGFEPIPSTTKPRQTTNLKLVTLSPTQTTPLPPFKYTRSIVNIGNNGNVQFRPPTNIDQTPTSVVRFPAQPWQIPPRIPLAFFKNQPNIFSNLFEVTPQPGFPPANPFANVPQPSINNPLNLTVFPFIPIGTSNPPWVPPGAIQPQLPMAYVNRETEQIHKSPLRVGFAKTRELPFTQSSFGKEELGLPPNIENIKNEFSIDAKPRTDSVDFKQPYNPYKPSAKTFVTEKTVRIPDTYGKTGQVDNLKPVPQTESLREYMRVHPNAANAIYKPPQQKLPTKLPSPQPAFKQIYSNVSRPSVATNNIPQQAIVPVEAFAGGPSMTSMGMMPTSRLNPNQKLDSCCRKQQVSSTCQSLCNFDSFNDKTLVSAFLTNQCPGPQLGKAYDCASSKADHSACCQEGGLQTFLGGRCMPFCRTHQATPANVLEYISCLQVFETIKNCYRQYQYSNKNIFGD